MSGANPITFEQMKAYTEITGNIIGPKESAVIIKLDKEFLKVMNG